jgi:hypothetical protein
VEAFVMMRKMSLFLPAVLLTLAGCASHYIVHDPASGNTYYTRDVDRTGDSGSVKFKDDATGAHVIIQQSEVRRVSEDEYEAGVRRGK